MSITVQAMQSRLETLKRTIPTQGRLDALQEAKIAACAKADEINSRRHGENELDAAIAERAAAEGAFLAAQAQSHYKSEAVQLESLLTARERIPSVARRLEQLEAEHKAAHESIAALDEALKEQRAMLESERELEAKFSVEFVNAVANGRAKPKRPATNTVQTEAVIAGLKIELEAKLLEAATKRTDVATAKAELAHAVRESAKMSAIEALDSIRDALAAWRGALKNVSGIASDKIELADMHGLSIRLERRYGND